MPCLGTVMTIVLKGSFSSLLFDSRRKKPFCLKREMERVLDISQPKAQDLGVNYGDIPEARGANV